MDFRLVSEFKPTGDQPQAIEQLVFGVENGLREQVLLGVTGSGKTFTMASVIEKLNRPTLLNAKFFLFEIFLHIFFAGLVAGDFFALFFTCQMKCPVLDSLRNLKYCG